MSLIRKTATAAATFGIALGLGYLVQHGDASAARYGDNATRPVASSVTSIMLSKNDAGVSVFGVHDVVTTPLPHIENVQTVAAVDESYAEMQIPAMGTIVATPLGNCQAELTANPQIAATVELLVSAPCHPSSYFVVRHEGMRFSAVTDAEGNAIIDVPALAEDARFSVLFDNVEVADASITIADSGSTARAELQWRGADNLQLHALEFGATFGDPGHVWSASANQMELTQAGERGFMVRLGAPAAEIAYQVEVYTFPSGLLNRDGNIVLQVGAAVTPENCGREVDAKGIQTNSGKMLISRDLKIAMPGCDSIGESLMLRDMFNDVTIAAR